MELDGAQVVVIGAGVSGLSTAWWLTRAGVDTIVVDKGVVGWEASGRNGGSVSHRGYDPPVIALATESLRLWPTMDQELGYPTEFRAGSIRVALNEQELEETREAVAEMRLLGIDTQMIDAQAIKELVPLVSENALGGSFSKTAGHANPQRSVQAFAWAIQDQGGRIYQHAQVLDFRVSGDRVTAVETSRGTIAADFVVCASGPQTGHLAEKVGAFVPVAPGRVEMVVTAPLEPMWPGAVAGNGLYGRQTLRGNLAYGGGPHEWVDVELGTPRKPNTPLVRNLARRLAELFPGAADIPVIRSWAGVVEQTPDYLPIIDFLERPSNYLVVTASAHGFGLSPATGKVVSDLVLHGESSIDIGGLGLRRFADVRPDWREERGWIPAPERS